MSNFDASAYPVSYTLGSLRRHVDDCRTRASIVRGIPATIRDVENRLVDGDQPMRLDIEADNSFAGVEKCVAGGMTARAAGTERSS